MFFRSINIMPGTGKRVVVLALPQEGARALSYILVRPATGRQQKPVPRDLLTTKYAPYHLPGCE